MTHTRLFWVILTEVALQDIRNSGLNDGILKNKLPLDNFLEQVKYRLTELLTGEYAHWLRENLKGENE